MKSASPPPFARFLLRIFIPIPHRAAVLEDLDEDFRKMLETQGSRVAKRHYWLEVLRARPLAWLWRRVANSRATRPGPMGWWVALGADVRLGLRAARRRPGFAFTVMLMFALGVGATTAVFSVVDARLLEPLPYQSPRDLVAVWNRLENRDIPRARVSGPDFLDYRLDVTELEAIAGIWVGPSTLTGDGGAVRISAAKVTENFFAVLGVTPLLGRMFRPGEGSSMDFTTVFDRDAARVPGAVVLNHGLWTRRFGRDPGIIGRRIIVAGLPVTVVGVLSPDFTLRFPAGSGIPSTVDLFEAFRSADLSTNPREARWLSVVARLGPGVSVERAGESLARVESAHRATFPGHAQSGVHAVVAPFAAEVTRDAAPILIMMLGAVGFVLLIACANVTNLQLVRALGRRRETAVRLALGGSRGSLARQLVAENGVLALGGGAGGVALAYAGVRALDLMRPTGLASMEVGLDLSVLAFAIVVTGLAALASGLIPAVLAAPDHTHAWLTQRSSTSSRGTSRTHVSLVIGEVALSLVLLLGAVTMLAAVRRLQDVDPGFRADGVMTATLAVPDWKYRDPASRLALFQRIADRLDGLPGVEAIGGADRVPLTPGAGATTTSYWLPDDPAGDVTGKQVLYRGVLPGYLRSVGTPVRAGRGFTDQDMRSDARPVVVVDETFARQSWPGERAIGQRFEINHFDGVTASFVRRSVEVVGVVDGVRFEHLALPPTATVYLPLASALWTDELTLTIRSTTGGAELAGILRTQLAAVDPDIPVSDPVPLAEIVRDNTAALRFMSAIAGGFALLAVVLASVGLYGVIAFLVRERTGEIAIRMAFGADATRMQRSVLIRGSGLGVAGVALGSVGGWFAGRILENRVLGVAAADIPLLLGTGAAVVLVAAVASLIPARRAATVDPVVTLRDG